MAVKLCMKNSGKFTQTEKMQRHKYTIFFFIFLWNPQFIFVNLSHEKASNLWQVQVSGLNSHIHLIGEFQSSKKLY